MEIVHPILANALSSLKKGDAETAEKGFARAAAACVQEFGETDIVTARTLAHLARVCASRGKVDLAVQMYERTLRIHEALPVPSSSDCAIAMVELSELLTSSVSSDAARSLRRRADCIMTKLQTRLDVTKAKINSSAESSSDEGSDNADEGSDNVDEEERSDDDSSGTATSPTRGNHPGKPQEPIENS